MTNKISIEGPIKIETKEEKTSLIKRSKDKLPECSKSKDKSKDNLRYSLHWDYTTNKSGKQQFTFTGKEMGDSFWSPEEKSNLKVGDLIIYKKKGHPNFNYKARIYAKTGLISKIDALKKGIMEKLPDVPDTYDIKFMAPPVIGGNRTKRIKGVKIEEMEKIPGYRFFFCYPTPKKSNKYLYHSPQFHNKIKSEMKKGFLKDMDWNMEKILAKHAGVTKDTLTGKAIPSDKLVEQPNSVKFKIAEVELIEISDPVHLHKGKPQKEVHKIRVLVHIRLYKVEKEDKTKHLPAVPNAEQTMSMLDCKNHKKRTFELIKELREASAKQAASFSEYLGDKLAVKYAKNEYNEIEWYQNKAKKEIADIYYKKRVDKRNKKLKEKKDHRTNWKKKSEDEVKKSKKILELAGKQAKEEQRATEQKFDSTRAKEDVMDERKENNQDKSTSNLKDENPYVTDFSEEQKKKNEEKELDEFVDDSDDEDAKEMVMPGEKIENGNETKTGIDVGDGTGNKGGGTRKHRRRRNKNTKKRRNKNK
jgi:hypothetical protein